MSSIAPALDSLKLLGQYPVVRAVYQFNQDVREVYRFGDQRPLRVPLQQSVTGEFDLYSTDVVEYDRLFARLTAGMHARTSRYIGPAAECPYCGVQWLPGTLLCSNCGSPTLWNPTAIEYTGLRALVTDISMTVPWDDVATLHVSVEYTEEPASWHDALVGFFDDRPGDWLCGMCGCYVSGYTSKCPGCAGNRVAISKLHELERECIYCGTRMQGGFACVQCNQRLARSVGLKSGTVQERRAVRRIV